MPLTLSRPGRDSRSLDTLDVAEIWSHDFAVPRSPDLICPPPPSRLLGRRRGDQWRIAHVGSWVRNYVISAPVADFQQDSLWIPLEPGALDAISSTTSASSSSLGILVAGGLQFSPRTSINGHRHRSSCTSNPQEKGVADYACRLERLITAFVAEV